MLERRSPSGRLNNVAFQPWLFLPLAFEVQKKGGDMGGVEMKMGGNRLGTNVVWDNQRTRVSARHS